MTQGAAVEAEVRRLGAGASIEAQARDLDSLAQAAERLGAGRRVFISHMPGQRWDETIEACRRARAAGLEPVPHVPVRLLEDAGEFQRLLAGLVAGAGVRELLLIAGDYAKARGPFACVADVLALGALEQHGISRVSLAGHPEGHPRVPDDVLRDAELAKVVQARARGLQVSMVTQFAFEAEPYFDWVRASRARGIEAEFICGLAGPASLTTLVRYGLRCGVGASIRALGAHRGTVAGLLAHHGPERLIRQIAARNVAGDPLAAGLHIFSFGGFLKTATWLQALAAGDQ